MCGQNGQKEQFKLYACSIGHSLFLSSILSLLSLQSSINVKHSLGTISNVFLGASGFVSSLFICPVLLKLLGPKKTLLTGEIVGTLYTVANFYPNWYTMIFGAIAEGFGDSTSWVSSSVIIASIGISEESHQSNLGIFSTFISFGQMILSALTVAILASMDKESEKHSSFMNTSTSESNNLSYVTHGTRDISKCGSNDCPAEYSYQRNAAVFEMLIPSDKALYVLLAIYLGLQISAIILHCIALPSDTKEDESSPLIKPRKQKVLDSALTSIKTTFRHFFSWQGLLTLPIQIWFGVIVGFVWTEFTRAFVACVLGVEQIGSANIVCTAFLLGASLLMTKCTQKFSMRCVLIVQVISEEICYVACLLWVPSQDSVFVPYILAGSFGIIYGSARLAALTTSVVYFSNHDTSCNIQMAMIALGSMIIFGLSTPLCVYMKLYCMAGLSIVVAMFWMIADFRFRKYGPV